MAKDVITRFKLETTGFDSKIKEAAKNLSAYSKTATQAKEGFNQFTKANVDAARALGSMATSTTNVKDRVKELVGAYNDAAKAYNALSDEQKQSDWAKALAGSLTQLQQRIKETKAEMQGLGDGMKGGGGLFSGIGSKMEGALAVFGGNLMTKASEAVVQLGSEMYGMVQQGIEMARQGEGIRIAFERLGRGDILDGLRQATHGTVTDLELMKAAVKFNDFKLPIEELGTMLAFAQQKAKDTGQSVDYMVDSIVTGLGRKSLMILDNLGLSATEIRERMKETGDMTKAVGAIIREQMASAGKYVETAADRAAQANVSLQNKMEELGRKFAPIEEASNQLWTSIKIGILDIIGGPLARLLNDLTEAGRMKNALNDMGGNEQVDKQLGKLRVAQAAGSGYMTRSLYSEQVEQYNRQINTANDLIKKYDSDHSSVNTVLMSASRQFGQKFNSISELKAFRDAYVSMKSEYMQGSKDIMKPVNVNVNTKQAEQNVESLRKQLKELEEQRKKAVKAGDQEQVESLTKQISQTKTNLGYLDPSANKGAKAVQDDFTEIIGLIGNAQERVSDLQRQIRESWDQNEVTILNQKLKDAQNELDVLMGKLPKDTVVDITVDANTADALQKIGDIEGMTIKPKNMTVTADTTEALQRIQKLVAEMNGTIIEMKVVPVVTDEDIERSLREQYGKPIEVPIVPKTTGEAIEQEIRVKLAEQNMDADMQTLRTIMETQIQNGLEGINIPSDSLIQKIMDEGMDIPDEYWEGLQDKINKKLEELDIDPIQIDFSTGNVKKQSKEMSKEWQSAASAIQSVGSAMSQIEDPAAKVMGTIAQAIATIALTFAQSLKGTFTPWDWIAAAAAGTATMISTIAAIHSATGYANGGMIKGNSYSGDNLMAMGPDGGLIGLNAGEIVLNKAQTANVASALQDNSQNGGINSTPYVSGETIFLGLNAYLKRSGRGELVVSRTGRS